MKYKFIAFVLLLSTSAYAQTPQAHSASGTSKRPAQVQWFSNGLINTTNLAAYEANQDKALITKIRWELESYEDSPTIQELNLPGTLQDQKRAVYAELEYFAAQGYGFEETLEWARKQGIRHPQEALLIKAHQQMEKMNFPARLKYIETLPSNLKNELISGSTNCIFISGDTESLKRILDYKSIIHPKNYYGFLQTAVDRLFKYYNSEKDLALIERLIVDYQTDDSEDPKDTACTLWNGLKTFEENAAAKKNENSELYNSSATRKLRLAVLKPLLRYQKNKTTCEGQPDIDKYAQQLIKSNHLTLADYTELKMSVASQTGHQTKNNSSSEHVFTAGACGLSEIQSTLRNTFLDLNEDKNTQFKQIFTMTPKNCSVQIKFHNSSSKGAKSILSQIIIRSATGKKLMDLKKDFVDSNALVAYLATGKLPDEPSTPKARVLTDKPTLSKQAGTSLQ